MEAVTSAPTGKEEKGNEKRVCGSTQTAATQWDPATAELWMGSNMDRATRGRDKRETEPKRGMNESSSASGANVHRVKHGCMVCIAMIAISLQARQLYVAIVILPESLATLLAPISFAQILLKLQQQRQACVTGKLFRPLFRFLFLYPGERGRGKNCKLGAKSMRHQWHT